ncbi:unnamed protein product [Caretta caretta]
MALRRSQVLSFLREGGYSVIFLKETHTDPTAKDSWRLEWGDRVYFSHSTIRQAGVLTLFSPDLRPEVLGVTEAMPGHLLHLWVRIERLVVNLVNVYAPTLGPEQVQFYQQASAFLGTLDSHECLPVGGGFVTSFQEFWLAWRVQRRAFLSARQWWDLGKVRARHFCRDYTRETSQRRNAAIEQLEWEVLELERRLAASPKDPLLCGACREKQEELQALEDHRAWGTFVRSHIRLFWEMDCGSRFFYALEKMRGAKKHITCLLAEDGTLLTEPAEMCGRARAFYASLFSPDPTDPSVCRVLWEELPTVSASDRDWLELPLTLAKFLEALRRMPTNKSPGMDGLTVEFYRVFWDVLGPDLVTVWAESLQSGVFPLSCSTDYKIVAKTILLRLGSVLVDVIHPDQTYTVPDRSIFDNLFLVRDLLELGCRDGLSFTLLSLDQEKVFDRVDHGYLLSTLQAFGFGPQFVGFLHVLYTSAECLVKLNWTLTEPVSFGRGVRQGCPLSGQPYALEIKPFLCLLCRRLTALVLQKPELQLVLLAYADDVLLVIQDPGDLAWVEAFQAIYSAASSAQVNWVKSSGLAVGDWRQVSSLPPVFQTIRWSAGPLLYLGVYLSATHPSPLENWENLEGGVIEWLQKWTGLL